MHYWKSTLLGELISVDCVNATFNSQYIICHIVLEKSFFCLFVLHFLKANARFGDT